jgi:hypothetical protein
MPKSNYSNKTTKKKSAKKRKSDDIAAGRNLSAVKLGKRLKKDKAKRKKDIDKMFK